MKHSTQHPSGKNLYLSSTLTTAGDDPFSPLLKLWVFSVKNTQSLDLPPSVPHLTNEMLRTVQEDRYRHDRGTRHQTPPCIDISWFDLAMQPASGPLKPSEIMPVIAGITNMLKERYFDEVDLLLKSFKVKNAAPEIMVALLRTTFPLRGNPLRHWLKLLRQVRSELTSRELDSEKILRGLL